MAARANTIPYRQIFQKLDEYINSGNFAAAELHLKLWVNEADNAEDYSGKMALLNEQLNLYRSAGKQDQCLETIDQLLKLIQQQNMGDTIAYATMLINIATAYKSFGFAGDAISLYEKALPVYESKLDSSDTRLVSLYNNMALTLTGIGVYKRSYEMYKKAIAILEMQECLTVDIAITYLNLADLVKEDKGLSEGEQQIREYIAKADEILDSPKLNRDFQYALACTKCAPIFANFGYFNLEEKYADRASELFSM